MTIRFILSDYVSQALAQTVCDKLEDGSFAGKIPPCAGVVAFSATLQECETGISASSHKDCT